MQKEPSLRFLDKRNADFQKVRGLPMAIEELTDFCLYDYPHLQDSGNHHLIEVRVQYQDESLYLQILELCIGNIHLYI